MAAMESENSSAPTYRVLADYEVTDHRPLILGAGESVEVLRTDQSWPGWVWVKSGETAGWIPEGYLVKAAGAATTLARPFNGNDLSAKRGELLRAQESANGWILAINESGNSGWFPLFNLRPVPQT